MTPMMIMLLLIMMMTFVAAVNSSLPVAAVDLLPSSVPSATIRTLFYLFSYFTLQLLGMR